MSILENDYDINTNADDKTDSYALFDEYTIKEIEHDTRLSIISSFKQVISKEPEFYAIFSLSSFVILSVFKESNNVKFTNDVLTNEQLDIFKSTYFEIYNLYPEDIYLHKIGSNLLKKMYV
jgi:hypothetical protein